MTGEGWLGMIKRAENTKIVIRERGGDAKRGDTESGGAAAPPSALNRTAQPPARSSLRFRLKELCLVCLHICTQHEKK